MARLSDMLPINKNWNRGAGDVARSKNLELIRDFIETGGTGYVIDYKLEVVVSVREDELNPPDFANFRELQDNLLSKVQTTGDGEIIVHVYGRGVTDAFYFGDESEDEETGRDYIMSINNLKIRFIFDELVYYLDRVVQGEYEDVDDIGGERRVWLRAANSVVVIESPWLLIDNTNTLDLPSEYTVIFESLGNVSFKINQLKVDFICQFCEGRDFSMEIAGRSSKIETGQVFANCVNGNVILAPDVEIKPVDITDGELEIVDFLELMNDCVNLSINWNGVADEDLIDLDQLGNSLSAFDTYELGKNNILITGKSQVTFGAPEGEE